MQVIIAAAAGVVLGIVFLAIFVSIRKNSAIKIADKIRKEADKEAEHILRDARVSAKSETIKLREECESELKERRKEQQIAEKRLIQREENLERKADVLDKKVADLEKKEGELSQIKERMLHKEQELKQNIDKQIHELERIAQLDRESAKNILLEKLKNEVKNESGILVRTILDEAKEKAEKESRRILTCAIQRYASECTYERTTATIPLPNEELKGRIIGREGRNIRAI